MPVRHRLGSDWRLAEGPKPSLRLCLSLKPPVHLVAPTLPLSIFNPIPGTTMTRGYSLKRKITIGSRGSELALTQSESVRTDLLSRHDDLQVDLEIIKTKGDSTTSSLRGFGGQGVFTGELEAALLDKRIDLAVHSLKDLPTLFDDRLTVAAVPLREDVRDVVIGCPSLDRLPENAVVGTGSLRRRAQLLALRPDLRFADVRGNLDTRIRKVQEGTCDVVVLAAAGLIRLGWQDRIDLYLALDQMLPAAGQGALGLQIRRDDALAEQIAPLDHRPSHLAVLGERSVLRTLEGGCRAPVATWGAVREGLLRLEAIVGRPDGSLILRAEVSGPAESAVDMGITLGGQLIDQGAEEILNESTNSA